MKTSSKIIIGVMILLLVIGSLTAVGFASTVEPAPAELSVKSFSVSLENAVFMNFKVRSANVENPADIELLAWEEAPSEYKKGTEDLCITESVTEDKTGYEMFQYTDLAAKDMTKMVYVCAYINEDGVESYSAPSKLSVAMYADMKRNATTPDEDLVKLLDSMLAYGAQAQLYFNHNTDFLATDPISKVSVVSGKLDDGFALGWYKLGSTVTLTADPAEEGYVFSHWKNSAGKEVSTDAIFELKVTESDETYTAVYEKIKICGIDFPHTIVTDLGFDATCTSSGLTDGEHCSVCGEVMVEQTVIQPTGEHTFGEWETVKEATTTEEGLMERACGCGEKETQTIEKLVQEFAYTLNADRQSYSVTGIGSYTASDLIIPDTYKGLPVTRIGNSAFYDLDNITSVIIPNTVTSIGERAFQDCKNLATVTLSNQLITIEKFAFVYCESLEDIELPKTLTSIGEMAFGYCKTFKEITIPEGVTEIPIRAFRSCFALETVYLPDTITSIDTSAFDTCWALKNINIPACVKIIPDYAFYDCTSLTSIIIPDGVTTIEYQAFYNSGITSITIPDSVTNIGERAFGYCRNLTNVTLSNKVISIANDTFYNCTSLTTITIPDSVTNIGNYAFYNCSSLTSITLGNGIKVIGDYAFRNCDNISSVFYMGTHAKWEQISIGAYNFRLTDKIHHYSESQPTNEDMYWHYVDGVPTAWPYIVVSNGLYYSSHGDGTCSVKAIYNCSDTNLIIPTKSPSGDRVTSIGDYAFDGCSGLTSITILDSVTSIGSSAFRGCSGLTSITILGNVTSIGNGAFEDCWRLTSIEIPNSVTSIGSWAFDGCSGLTSIVIPDSVTSIGNGAFNDCWRLTSIEIPNSVTSIGSSAFSGCSGLTSIVIPDSVTSIGSSVFNECSSLTSIEIPDSVTSIGYTAFKECSSLTNVVIPDSVTSIDYSAFYYCSNLKSINFSGTKAQWNAIYKGSAWNSHTGNYTIYCTDGNISK